MSTANTGDSFPEITLAMSPSASDLDGMRGRKRDRSPAKSTMKPIRPDESSTLRGRSRRRAISPLSRSSRNSSPSMISPTKKHIALYTQLRDARREHCPSRTASPTGQRAFRRRHRTRSRSRGVGLEQELHALSSLRNEILLRDEDDEHDEEEP